MQKIIGKMAKLTFKENYIRSKSKVDLWGKRIYVCAFNIYIWYWLYREIFVRYSTDWENYLLWFFTMAGMYYFVLDSSKLFFKNKTVK
jgi:hypothetical protein